MLEKKYRGRRKKRKRRWPPIFLRPFSCANSTLSFPSLHEERLKDGPGTSLVVQWLRISLTMQGTPVWFLVGELKIPRTTALSRHNSWVWWATARDPARDNEDPASHIQDPTQPNKLINFKKEEGPHGQWKKPKEHTDPVPPGFTGSLCTCAWSSLTAPGSNYGASVVEEGSELAFLSST